MKWLRRALATTAVLATGISLAGAATSGAAPSALTATPLAASAPLAAAAPVLQYYYNFAKATGHVANSAPGGPTASLKLSGDWSLGSNGVHFRGGTNGLFSVAYGRPATGDTLKVPTKDAVGVRVKVLYDAPTSGKCFGDTPNIAQIGRFIANDPQVKVQLSKCADSRTQVMIQCRFAGALTPITVDPVQSALHLVSGDHYNATCIKSPDSGKKATVTMSVTRLTGTSKTVSNTFTVAATGAMVTKQYISVGNKYPVPVAAKNTDQFNGDVDWTRYCVGSLSAVKACVKN